MVKDETEYSTPWKTVNITANIIVNTKPYNDPLLFPCIKEWWAYVTVTPDDNKITVLANGKCHGFKTSMPFGGQTQPIPTAGDVLTWKNVQKNEKKNITSDEMNRIIP